MKMHVAQFNIARMRAPLTDPLMADFVAQLDPINTLADEAPGFVWRLQAGIGGSDIRLYGDEPILANMSVWETVEDLREYVYKTAHLGPLQDRKRWFDKIEEAYYVMWWVPAGYIPTPEEGNERLDYLRANGETEHAFSLKRVFPPSPYRGSITPSPDT